MSISRSQARVEMQGVRADILALANHLQMVHGVRPEDRDRTNPETLEPVRLRRWATRYGVDLRTEDDELRTESDLRAACTERQQHPPGATESMPTLDELQRAYDSLKQRRAEILAEVDETLGIVGPPQTVAPRGVDVEVLTGIIDRAGGAGPVAP